MNTDNETRRRAVLEVAGRLLIEKGYAPTSMLQIAKAARASNETLYKWWPNKQALFADLVTENAALVVDALRAAAAADATPLEVLERIAPVLLRMLTGPLAIALNRAAAADSTGTRTLGPVLAVEGRERVGAALADLMRRAIEAGEIASPDAKAAVALFVTLLVGDLQIRLATGALTHIDEVEVEARARTAIGQFKMLMAHDPSWMRGSGSASPAPPSPI